MSLEYDEVIYKHFSPFDTNELFVYRYPAISMSITPC